MAKGDKHVGVGQKEEQIKKNSLAWHTASDAEKKRLEAENAALRKSLGYSYNSGTGVTNNRAGQAVNNNVGQAAAFVGGNAAKVTPAAAVPVKQQISQATQKVTPAASQAKTVALPMVKKESQAQKTAQAQQALTQAAAKGVNLSGVTSPLASAHLSGLPQAGRAQMVSLPVAGVQAAGQAARQANAEKRLNLPGTQMAANSNGYQKAGLGQNVLNVITGGVGAFNRGLAQTADFLLPDVVTPKALQDVFEGYKQAGDKLQQNAVGTAQASGGNAGRIAAELGVSTVQAIPQAVMALLSGGTSAAASAANTLQGAGAPAGVISAVQGMMKKPGYWAAFAQELGSDYEESKAGGASEGQATVSAMVKALINAGIEVGGGIDEIAGQDRTVKNWLKSAVEEGTEEVKQGVVSGLADKGVWDKDRQYLSAEDDSAVINPARMAQEFAGGAVVGGVLGAGALPIFGRNANVQTEERVDSGTPAAQAESTPVVQEQAAPQFIPQEVQTTPQAAPQVQEQAAPQVEQTEQVVQVDAQAAREQELLGIINECLRDRTPGAAQRLNAAAMELAQIRAQKTAQVEQAAQLAQEHALPQTVQQDAPQVEQTAQLAQEHALPQTVQQDAPQVEQTAQSAQEHALPQTVRQDAPQVEQTAQTARGVQDSGLLRQGTWGENEVRPQVKTEEEVRPESSFVDPRVQEAEEARLQAEIEAEEAKQTLELPLPHFDRDGNLVQPSAAETAFAEQAEQDGLVSLPFGRQESAKKVLPLPMDQAQENGNESFDALLQDANRQEQTVEDQELADHVWSVDRATDQMESLESGLPENAEEMTPGSPAYIVQQERTRAERIAARHPVQRATHRVDIGDAASRVDGYDEAVEIVNSLEGHRLMLKSLEKVFGLSKAELVAADEIAQGRNPSTPLKDVGREEKVRAYANSLKQYNADMEPVREYQRKVRAARDAEADALVKDSAEWTDSKRTLNLELKTPERAIDSVCGKDAEKVNNAIIKPVHEGQAQSTRFQNEMREKLREIAKTLTRQESVYIHMKNRADLAGADSKVAVKAQQYLEKHRGKIDVEKCADATAKLIDLTISMHPDISEAYIRNGYDPLEFLTNYIPSLNKDVANGRIAKILNAMGFKTAGQELPSDIAGRTAERRPGRQYAGFANERTGTETEFDAIKAIDNYITNAANVIYQTDNIQNLRAFEERLRFSYSDEGTKAEVTAIKANPALSYEEKQAAVLDAWDKDRGNLPSFPTWLADYTNILAGKKSFSDRRSEDQLGRGFYTTVSSIEGKVAGNMVGGNLATAITNFIPLTQAAGEVKPQHMLKGIMQYSADLMQGNTDFDNKSTFLTNRHGSERVPDTTLQKLSNQASAAMGAVDHVSSGVLTRAMYNQYLAQGMDADTAMDKAGTWTAALMADRSKGAQPVMMNNKSPLVKALTMFQLEQANQFGYLFHDLPKNVGEGKGKTAAMAAFAGALLRIFIAGHLFNDAQEKISGSRSALDPVDMMNGFVGRLSGYELPNTVDEMRKLLAGEASADDFKAEGADGSVVGAVSDLGKAALEEVPGIGSLLGGGRIPLSSALPKAADVSTIAQAVENKIKGQDVNVNKTKKALADSAYSLSYLALPFGAGQLKKTLQGAEMMRKGGSYNYDNEDKAQLQYADTGLPLGQAAKAVQADGSAENVGALVGSAADRAQKLMFGKSATAEAREWRESGYKSGLSAKETEVYESLRSQGVSNDDAVSIIRLVSGIEGDKGADGKTVSGSKARNQRQAIYDNDRLTAEQKRALDLTLLHTGTKYQAADYGKPAGDFAMEADNVGDAKTLEAAQAALRAGVSYEKFKGLKESFKSMDAARDVTGEIVDSQKNLQRDALFADKDLSVAQKALIDRYLIKGRDEDGNWQNSGVDYTNEDSYRVTTECTDSRVEDWYQHYNGKMDTDTFLGICEKYKEINKEYSGQEDSAQKSATALSKYLDTLGLSKDEREIVNGDFKYYNMFPASSAAYRYDMLTSESEKKVSNALAKSGFTIEQYNDFEDAISGLKADKDKNGKTVSGSKKAKVVAYINGLGVSAEVKSLLMESQGYKASGSSGGSTAKSGLVSLPGLEKLKGF